MSSRVILLRLSSLLLGVVVGDRIDSNQQKQGSGAIHQSVGGHHAVTVGEWGPKAPMSGLRPAVAAGLTGPLLGPRAPTGALAMQ